MDTLKTKIITTIGPATLSPQIFQQLVDNSIDYIRINTSYGDTAQYDQMLDNLKNCGDHHVQIIYDLKQIEKLDYALEHDINHIAVSFVESADSINKVRELIPNAFIIAKIESKQGVRNFDKILSISDGIMVARGDLGKAVSLEKVPPLQKEFTRTTLKKGKFLVTATEMLLSMVNNPEPTRAEVSDVANAVFDHSSAVMLSEETAIGKYPIETVAMMRRIIIEAEAWNNSR
jgi:pyruvate kinase